MADKTCSKCGETKALAEFPKRNDGSSRDGLNTQCRVCIRERKRQYNQAHAEQTKEWQRQYRAEHREHLLEEKRKWYQLNRDRHREMGRKWRENNPDHSREYSRRWRANNPDKSREHGRNWRREHPDLKREDGRKWRLANPDKMRTYREQRRARKLNAEGTYTVADMRRQYKAQKGLCWWCSKPVKWEDREDDHLIPLNKGGTNWPNNMVVSCLRCNRSKSDKTPDEFAGRLF